MTIRYRNLSEPEDPRAQAAQAAAARMVTPGLEGLARMIAHPPAQASSVPATGDPRPPTTPAKAKRGRRRPAAAEEDATNVKRGRRPKTAS